MITVITGLINAGKTTFANYLVNQGYKFVLEYTTRPMRHGERNNVDYHFVDDDEFDKMAAAGEFAETLYVQTIYGLWKYGARKEDLKKDLKDDYLLVCGCSQMIQLLDSDIPVLSVLLDIDRKTAMGRALARGDKLEEFNRRFTKDEETAEKLYNRVDLVLDAKKSIEENARIIEDIRKRKW